MICRRLEGRVAVVTGGASGIGAASARRLAEEGASVVVADIDDEAGVVVAQEISVSSGTAVYIHCDVAEAADWERLRQLVQDRWGRLDILHSNAFSETVAPAHELEEDGWDRTLAVNLKATYLGAQALVGMLGEHRGSVVLTSSVQALIGLPGRPAYAAAKGGLCALARQLAVEYGPEIRVNTVLPGPIFTPAWASVSDADRESSVAETLAKRFGQPSEVAAAVAFLASSDASYITGANLVVDGGWSVMKASS